MQDASVVRGSECVSHLFQNVRGAVERHALGGDGSAQSHAIHILHHEERLAIGGVPAVDGNHDAGMIDHGERPHFFTEFALEPGIID